MKLLQSIFERLLGFHWKTTVSGVLAWVFLAAGMVAGMSPSELDIFPPQLWPYKISILKWCLFLSFISKVYNEHKTKDKDVTK